MPISDRCYRSSSLLEHDTLICFCRCRSLPIEPDHGQLSVVVSASDEAHAAINEMVAALRDSVSQAGN